MIREEPVLWVLVAVACPDCGGVQSVQVFAHEPSREEREAFRREAGGMVCLRLLCFHGRLGEVIDREPNVL